MIFERIQRKKFRRVIRPGRIPRRNPHFTSLSPFLWQLLFTSIDAHPHPAIIKLSDNKEATASNEPQLQKNAGGVGSPEVKDQGGVQSLGRSKL
ncbi:MAG: hypothetical protein ACRECL_09970 [Bradyrhizobium sp.]